MPDMPSAMIVTSRTRPFPGLMRSKRTTVCDTPPFSRFVWNRSRLNFPKARFRWCRKTASGVTKNGLPKFPPAVIKPAISAAGIATATFLTDRCIPFRRRRTRFAPNCRRWGWGSDFFIHHGDMKKGAVVRMQVLYFRPCTLLCAS